MKITGFSDWDWESSGYSGNLPPGWLPVVSVNPTVLPRPGTYATLGIGVVGEMTIPVEFLYRGTMTFEAAMLNLFKRLNPVDTTPRQLRGVRNDGTPVQIPAVLQISQIVNRDDANSVKVNFVAVQPYWEPLNVPAATIQVFESDGLRQSMLLDVLGEFPTNPTIRVMATAQRSSTTANVGWKYRRRYTIANSGSDPIQNYPYAIDLGRTDGLVSGGKALSSGNDLRVVYQGKEIARTLTDWNSGSFTTLAWIVIPYLAAGASITYDVLHGNANADSPPTLTAGTDLPAFDIATAGTNRSSNTKWSYLVDRTVGNAGKGGWYLSQGTSLPDAKYNVPGAWQLATTLIGNDDRSQQAYSSYVATGTKYQARFEARRAKAGSIVVTESNGADGVTLRNPVGISSVRADIRWLNMARGDTDTTPIGKVVILTRNSSGESWQTLYENAALNDPESTIATATYTPAAAVKEVAFAVWPQGTEKQLNIDPKARNDRYINAAWYTTLEVNIQSGVLTQSSASWSPEMLGSKLKAWHNANAITGVSNGANLATWSDLSGSGNHATQATGGSQPIYRTNQINALPAVEFTTEKFMASAVSASSLDESVFAAIKVDDLATVQSIIIPQLIGGRMLSVRADGSLAVEKSGGATLGATAASAIAAATATIVGSTLGATTWELRVNGTPTSGSHAQSFTGGLASYIGNNGAPDFDGRMAEIIICQGAMTTDERQSVEGYLAQKYALTASLPSTHPYKASAPPAVAEVYEFATSLRYLGGGDTTGVPPYKSVRLGNAKGASGVGTPRLTAPLNKQVLVFTETRKVEQWNSGVTTKEEDVPIAAMSAADVVLDGGGNTVEQQSADWMPLLPTVNPLPNPDFDTDLSGWTVTGVSGLVTDVRFRSTTVTVTAGGSLAHNITASTLGSGGVVLNETSDTYIPIGNRQSVQMGFSFWDQFGNFSGRPAILFYDAAQAFLGSTLGSAWSPPASSFRRRLLAGSVPPGAVYVRVGFFVSSLAANAIGSFAADAFAVNDTEIAVIDGNTSGLTVGASWLNRYAYA